MSGIIDHGGLRATNISTPTAATDAATKGYVDGRDALLLPKSGGTMTGIINHGGQRATNIGYPSAATDAARKDYVDAVNSRVTGMNRKWTATSPSTAPYYVGSTTEILSVGGWIGLLAPPNITALMNGGDGKYYSVTIIFSRKTPLVVYDVRQKTMSIVEPPSNSYQIYNGYADQSNFRYNTLSQLLVFSGVGNYPSVISALSNNNSVPITYVDF